MSLPLDEAGRPEWDALTRKPALVYLNYPSNPTAAAAPNGVFGEAVALADWTDASVLHDFAYGDLVFDGRSAAELPRRAGSTRGRSRALLALQELRHGGLAARLRARKRGARLARDVAAGAHARRNLRRAAAGRDRGADRAAGDGGRAEGTLRSPSRPGCRGAPRALRRVARERSSSGFSSRTGGPASACSRRHGSRSRRAKASGRAVAVAHGSRSPSRTRSWTLASSGSGRRSPASRVESCSRSCCDAGTASTPSPATTLRPAPGCSCASTRPTSALRWVGRG